MRTPPQQQAEDPGNESIYPCQICLVVDNNPYVCCDHCQLWFHFTCVNAPPDVANREWVCPKCSKESAQTPISNQPQIENVNLESYTQPIAGISVPEGNFYPIVTSEQGRANQFSNTLTTDKVSDQLVTNLSNRSRKSKSATSSSSRRMLLAMQRLEEERKLELEERDRREKSNKEYLDKKYSLLELDGSEEDDLSYDDEELRYEQIRSWNEKVSKDTADKDLEIISQMNSTIANFNLNGQNDKKVIRQEGHDRFQKIIADFLMFKKQNQEQQTNAEQTSTTTSSNVIYGQHIPSQSQFDTEVQTRATNNQPVSLMYGRNPVKSYHLSKSIR